ncbi:MAG: cobalt-precorrin 5A hydrolase [Synergistaceae bacterium]|nr:cobalt-precorrin 5A hydrolase [Synergistaceae bacterium]
MKLCAAAFSERGAKLARLIALAFGGSAWAPENYAVSGVLPFGASLGEWTKERFTEAEALVFVSSCWIAVRAVAPYLEGKDKDPAVIVADERGLSVISLLSGHIGGANELALRIAETIGARPVITTATDVNGITPPDSWAVKNNCAIENLPAAKRVAAELLSGHAVGVAVTDELQPATYPVTLWLRPKNLIVGVGCKRCTEPELLRGCFFDFMKQSGYSPLSIASVASVEQKKDEAAVAGLAEFYEIHFETFSAETLMALPGEFTPSPAALAAVGTDNVCERAALAASRGGYMVRLKTKYPGITFALARKRSL